MKKILTLLIAFGAFGAVHAQSTKEEARRIVLGEGKNKGTSRSESGRDIILGDGNDNDRNGRTYPSNYPSSRQAQIEQVNREYDAKIYSIRNNNTLSQAEKERMIRQLEKDRNKKIKQIDNSYDDDRYSKGKKNKSYKSNNGKHKGWSKGKGNKHRDRDDD